MVFSPFGAIAFWILIGIATLVCVLAAIVVALDFFAAAPPPPRTEIRNRLRDLSR